MSGTDYVLTPNLGLYKPLPTADINAWGGHLNSNADMLDTALHSVQTAGPFLPLSGGTVTGVTTFSATLNISNDLVFPSVAPANSWSNTKTFINTNLRGSLVPSGTQQYAHALLCSGDQAQFTGGGVAGPIFFGVTHNFGGGNTQGWRTTTAINQTQVATTGNKAAGINPINVALVVNQGAQVADGGTGLQHPANVNATATAQGAYTSIGIQNVLYGGVSNTAGQLGMEIDVGGHAGASALGKAGLLIVKWGFDSYQSPINDAAILISDQGGAAYGWTTGIRIGSPTAQWPIDINNGTLLGAVYSNPGAAFQAAARYGIDFSDVAFPAFGTTRMAGFLSSNNFAVDGVGAVMIGSAYLTPSATGLAIDAKGLVSTGAAVAAGGSGYSVGDILYDPYGGMYRVATLSGTAVATVALYADAKGNTHAANYPSSAPPTNPIATTPWEFAANIASGCTLNLTWNTTATTLSLNPTGHQILTNLSAAATDAAAATAGVPIGGLYNNAGVVHVRLT